MANIEHLNLTYTYPLPWVVADWGVLRSLSRDQGLPGRFTIVIPDRLISEILGSEAPQQFLVKLNALLAHPSSHGRVLVGRYWNDIAKEERQPRDVVAGSSAAIHIDLSNSIRQAQRDAPPVFLTNAPTPAANVAPDTKEAFIALTKRYLEWLDSHDPSGKRLLAREGLQHRIRLVQESGDSMVALAGNTSRFKYERRAWRKVLREFPDRCAAARWMRLIFWYATEVVAAPGTADRRVGNNYDDSHYVFLSFYTNHLWTLDKGMAEAARAVSGNKVTVHTAWETIPVHSGGHS